MGYANYIDEHGRPAGYDVAAVCDDAICGEEIDRGMAYRCRGCGFFFCPEHLYWSSVEESGVEGDGSGLCLKCMDGVKIADD